MQHQHRPRFVLGRELGEPNRALTTVMERGPIRYEYGVTYTCMEGQRYIAGRASDRRESPNRAATRTH